MKHKIVTITTGITFVLCGFAFWETGYAEVILAIILILYLTITSFGSFQIQSNYFIKSINKGKKKAIALTFDDGPHPVHTPRILEILKEKGVKATFFVIGKNAEKYPELVSQIDSEGHVVANHSYSHHYFIAFFSTNRLTNDLKRCNEIVSLRLNKTPAFFRPPFGVTNPRYSKALKENNLQSIGWSLRSFDTRAKNKYQLIQTVISKLQKRDIVLLHDNLSVTADALEDLIEHCRSKNIEIQPLPNLVNREPYNAL